MSLSATTRAAGDVGVGQDQGELVAADARQDVAVAQDVAQRVADARQELVAGGVAEGVVDQLEAVQVEQHQRAGAAMAARAADLALELFLEAPAAEEARQRVAVGEVLQLVLEALALGDVDGLQDDQPLAVGAEREARHGQGADVVAVAMLEAQLARGGPAREDVVEHALARASGRPGARSTRRCGRAAPRARGRACARRPALHSITSTVPSL